MRYSRCLHTAPLLFSTSLMAMTPDAALLAALAGQAARPLTLMPGQPFPPLPQPGQGPLVFDQRVAGLAEAAMLTRRWLGLSVSLPLLLVSRQPDGSLAVLAGQAGSAPQLAAAWREQQHSPRRIRRSLGLSQTLTAHTLSLTLVHGPQPCPLARDIGKGFLGRISLENPQDACEGRATFQTRLRLDHFSSDSPGAPPGWPAGKYLRLSLGAGEAGGSGWHLSPQQHQQLTLDRGRTLRHSWFGPYAGHYSITIEPDGPAHLQLLEHEPRNQARGTTVDISRSATQQRQLQAGLSLHGSSAGVSLGESRQSGETRSTTLRYPLQEYRVLNRTRGNLLDLQWQLGLDEQMFRSDDEIREGALPVRSELFSGLSHANFLPGMLATWQVPVDEQGSTRFQIRAEARVMAALSRITPTQIAHYASSHDLSLATTVIVDWSAPLFRPELPLQVRAWRHDAQYCLTWHREGGEVSGRACDQSSGQGWALNRQRQLYAVARPVLCLALARDGRLRSERCQPGGHFEWRWQGEHQDRLVNLLQEQVLSIRAENRQAGAALLGLGRQCDDPLQPACAWRAYPLTPGGGGITP
ncbi:hypothetical protein THUN1379_00320 [Paludibacterium sp. THUN1379]|uniref:hypothetical protein n=1 Tax=Paludibacterium sp. THUN1379 TaxID=3112107 RepID=UPI003091F75A|nr:hypothetical protein THUN1379_00320 [Paludibacterium sp. THUN1379]